MTSEIFPAIHRGTGNCLTSTAKGVFGAMVVHQSSSCRSTCPRPDVNVDDGYTYLQAPIIALYAKSSTAVPVYIAGCLLVLAGSMVLLVPYEPRGKTSV